MELEEEWKDIENYFNYQVSNLGRVKSKERYVKVGIKNQKECLKKEKILKPQIIEKDIKSIVTHEQMEQMEYKDGE